MSRIHEIYRQCFGIDEEFETLLFKNCACYLKILEIENTPVSFLFALPCEINRGAESFKATYIFAAATDETHRKKGYMASLLEKVKNETEGILLLRPASKPLIDYYKKSGFVEFCAQDSADTDLSLIPLNGFKTLAENTEKTLDGKFTAMAFNSPINLDGLYFPYTMP